MELTSDEFTYVHDYFEDLCDKLDLAANLSLEISPYPPASGKKSSRSKEAVIIYEQKFDSLDEIIVAIRYEVRRIWQYENYREHTMWWRSNRTYFHDLERYSLLQEICTIEIDADQFARFGNTEYEILLERPVQMLEDTKKNFYQDHI